jgi:hypothetical protein
VRRKIIPGRSDKVACLWTVEVEHVLETLQQLPPKEATPFFALQKEFRPFSGQPNALEASAHSRIRVSARVRHENLKRPVFFYSFVFFQNRSKTRARPCGFKTFPHDVFRLSSTGRQA